MKNLAYINKYLWRYKWHLLLGTIFVALSNYFGILIPQKIGDALDFVKEKITSYKSAAPEVQENLFQDLSHTLMIFGLTVISFIVIKGILMYLMRQTIIVASRLIEYDLRKDIFAHLEHMDNSFYRSQKTGDIMARITEDVSKVRNYLGPGILYGINLTTLFVFVIYAMFEVNAELALYTLAPLPLLSYSIYWVSSRINIKSTIIQQQLGKLNSVAQETYSGIRVVKSYGKEQPFAQYFEQEAESYRVKSMDLVKINALFFPLMILLINFSTILVLLIGGYKVGAGTITYGNIAEFIIYVNMLTWPVTAIGWIASVVQQAEASQARINELLGVQPEIVSGNSDKKSINGDIKFENVSFIYPDSGIEAIKSINLHIPQGQKVAIIGKTASGKTTFAELLLRMYDATSGRILIDGEDITTLSLETIRQRIGYVPQDVFLFSDTISANISFGVEGVVSPDLIAEMADNAAVAQDIEKLPKSYDTIVGERGVTLSGGQKQRVSIARAFIKDPDLVILDDCLSAVDTETEQHILAYIERACQDKTTIVITHRVSGLMDFDRVIALANGRIIEDGSPADLAADPESYFSSVMMEPVS